MPKKPKSRSYSQSRSSRLAAKGSGYSWFVRITKVALPLVALAIMGAVVSQLSEESQIEQLAAAPATQGKATTPGQIEMVKAKYEGVDAKGRKYTLTADSATRDMESIQAVLLEKPRADIELEGGSALTVHADKGRYDNKASKLVLTGGVTAYHESGYEIHLQDISVDIGTRAAASLSPVTALGPIGELHAQNIAVTDQGMLVVFGGPAQVTLQRVKAKPPKKVPG